MKRNTTKYGGQIAVCLILVVFAGPESFCQTMTTTTVVREDVFAAKTADQFNTAYFNSTTNADKIAALSVLPMAIKRFKVNPQTAVPSWLSAILSDALKSTDLSVVQKAVEQIGITGLVSYADALISMYGQSTATPQEAQTIILRMKIIRAVGSLGTPAAGAFLAKIVDLHTVRPETDEAIAAIGRLCLTDLVPNLNSYVTFLSDQIKNNKFSMDDSAKKPLVSPDGSLNLALSIIQIMGSGNCGN